LWVKLVGPYNGGSIIQHVSIFIIGYKRTSVQSNRSSGGARILVERGQDFFLMNKKTKTKQELINKIKNITNEINK
jgi:hypothetical protein